MYNIGILDIHGNANISGVLYTPSFVEIENKQNGQIQYFNGSIIGGGGIFDLDSRGAVTLTVSREHAAGPPAAEVTDAFAGRAPAAAVLAALPGSTRTALSHLADFFTTPVDQSPA